MGFVERWIIAKYAIRRNIKKNKSVWIAGVALVLAVCTLVAYVVFFAPYISVTCHAGSCKCVFGCSASAFATSSTDLPDGLSFLKKNSRVDGMGHLILDLTRWQYHKLKSSQWIRDFTELEEWPCVSLSEDYYRITVTVTPEMRAYESAQLRELQNAVNAALSRIRFIDMINYPDEKDFYQKFILYREIDGVTGEILFQDYVVITRSSIDHMRYDGWDQ